jgi:hypothetical protein
MMICEEKIGKMYIFSIIFQKIRKPEFSKEAVFHKKLEKGRKIVFFPNFSSQIII